jgi:hypothetical protein
LKNFYTALQAYFNKTTGAVHNDFWNDIGGHLYHGEAEIPDGAEFPYCVLLHVVDTQVDTFKSKLDEIVIQFSIFSDKTSPVEVHDAMTDLKALFNDCSLTIAGSKLVQFSWLSDGLIRDEVTTPAGVQAVWHFHCDFLVILERT